MEEQAEARTTTKNCRHKWGVPDPPAEQAKACTTMIETLGDGKQLPSQ
jgi:hypothetical protein